MYARNAEVDKLQCWMRAQSSCSLQGVVYASPRVDEVNMSRDHSHGNIHVHNRADDSAHASTLPKPNDEAMV